MPSIQWYPGHMAKSRRLLQTQMKAVDAVIELCDARAPSATRNPDLNAICAGKQRVLVLNKADLADPNETQRWLSCFSKQGLSAVAMNCNVGKTKEILLKIQDATRPVVERMKARGVNKTVRLMVIGIPNVGKSTFINRLRGSNVAKASDRPGVTRSNQWVKVGPYLELLDTPGMLWPKLEDQEAATVLAYLGSIRDEIMDQEELAAGLLKRLVGIDESVARSRFKLEGDLLDMQGHELLEAACGGRGWLLSGGRPDSARAAAIVLDEFRGGKVGRVTLEMPEKK